MVKFASASRKGIRDDLLKQLEVNRSYIKPYIDLVDDYMKLYDIKTALYKDIKERGVSLEYNNGGGQTGRKKNDSIAEFNKTSAQMLKILSDLDLKPSKITKEGEDVEQDI